MNIVIFFYANLLLVFTLIVGMIFRFANWVYYLIFGVMFLITIVLFVYIFYFIYSLIRENKKFVPFVPTPMNVVNEMIKFANIKVGDVVYDLGCGDGRLVTEASKISNTKCIGIEWKADVVVTGKIRNFLKKGKAIIKKGDMYKENISDADVIFTYLLPHAMDRLEGKIASECKKTVTIVSHGFVFKNLNLQEEKQIGRMTIRKYSI